VAHNSGEILNTETLIATLEAAPGILIGLVREVPPQNLISLGPAVAPVNSSFRYLKSTGFWRQTWK
jgi:hypothetical protein